MAREADQRGGATHRVFALELPEYGAVAGEIFCWALRSGAHHGRIGFVKPPDPGMKLRQAVFVEDRRVGPPPSYGFCQSLLRAGQKRPAAVVMLFDQGDVDHRPEHGEQDRDDGQRERVGPVSTIVGRLRGGCR